MESKYEAVVYRTETISDMFFPGPSNRAITVRQLGEQLRIPRNSTIMGTSSFMSRERLDKWIEDYERGYTDYGAYLKSQVSWLERIKLKRLNVNLDTRVLADLWPDFVNFEKRRKTETPFLLDQLSEYTNPKVFDACLGSGATTIGLKLAGIDDILSNDIDDDLIKIAQKEAKKFGVNLNITSHDWRKLNGEYKEKFDAVICLGNSLTYLFKKKDQLKVLEKFKDILKPNGKLIIDERNYAHHFFGGRYKFSGDVVYCGKEKVSAHPIHVSNSMVVMEYEHREIGQRAHLVLYPFKQNELKELLNKVGFKDVVSFGDYRLDFKPEEPEFITHVCRK